MDYFVEKATFVLRAIQGGAGAYGAVMLAIMGYHYMTKIDKKLKKHKTV